MGVVWIERDSSEEGRWPDCFPLSTITAEPANNRKSISDDVVQVLKWIVLRA
jgi:hypothetical protein